MFKLFSLTYTLPLPQIAKKAQVSSAAPIKYIITKTVSKGLTSQTTVSPVIAGKWISS
jgi:hypothetical protein